MTQDKLNLPSNLDEVAEKTMSEPYAFVGIPDEYLSESVYSRELMIAMFKAGAEWMAKQGVSMEVVEGTLWSEIDNFIHRYSYSECSKSKGESLC